MEYSILGSISGFPYLWKLPNGLGNSQSCLWAFRVSLFLPVEGSVEWIDYVKVCAQKTQGLD